MPSLVTLIPRNEKVGASRVRLNDNFTDLDTRVIDIEARVVVLEETPSAGVDPVVIASIDTAIASEVSIRASDDSFLTASVANETIARTNADTSLTTRIVVEEGARNTGDTSLTTRLSTEESVRASVAVSLSTAIGTGGGAADASLTTRISVEESTRVVAVASLSTAIGAGGGAADASLSTRISTEESVRASTDTSLVTLLGPIGGLTAIVNPTVNQIDAGIIVASDVSTLTAADTSLTTRISAEESVRASVAASLSTAIGAGGTSQTDITDGVFTFNNVPTWTGVSGTGASYGPSYNVGNPPAGFGAVTGVVYLQTGTTSTGYVWSAFQGSGSSDNNGTVALGTAGTLGFSLRANIPVLSNGTESFRLRVGAMYPFGNPSNGVYFRVDDGIVTGAVMASSVETVLGTTATITANQSFRLRVHVVGGVAYFYFNGSLLGTLSSGLPASNAGLRVGYNLAKYIGATNRVVWVASPMLYSVI